VGNPPPIDPHVVYDPASTRWFYVAFGGGRRL
jgi:hypothetical protein